MSRVWASVSEGIRKMFTTEAAMTEPPQEIHGYFSTMFFNYRFLCTSAAAELVYLTALSAVNNRSLQTTSLSNTFYQRFLPSISEGIYPINSSEFSTLLSGLIAFGDSFLATVQQHAFENGSISEEFDRYVLPSL
jgi:hypothetical protein